MDKTLTETLQHIQTYKNIHPHYSELLDILEEILVLREEYRHRMKGDIFPVDQRLIAPKMAGGLPLIDFSSVPYDLTEPKNYFLALLEIAESRSPGETKEMARKIREGEISFNDMIDDSFNPPPMEADDAADEEEEHAYDLVELFLEESLRPALEKVVQAHGKDVRKSGWPEGYCPICGREPKIGEIRDDEGARYLYCNQCGFEWDYRRVKCPFCNNEEQRTLAYFTIEEDDRYRIDVCNECKRYIKIVDFRNTKEKANMDVEDIATLHLDMLANDEGYD